MSEFPSYFTRFNSSLEGIPLPEKFTFPFYYEPHPLAKLAAEELQEYLSTLELDHNFGLDSEKEGLVIGKMFGVLVVENEAGELGYLSAVSGKLANSNLHEKFVPPVFDMLTTDGFFGRGMQVLNQLNSEVELSENSADLISLKNDLQKLKDQAEAEISASKLALKNSKRQRQEKRESAQHISESEYEALIEELKYESLKGQYFHKDLVKKWKVSIDESQLKYDAFVEKINVLKNERRERSAKLQNQLFEQYNFLNAQGEERNVFDIFKPTASVLPPAGAGECAAPKLLQYAYLNRLKPICMAEFWWGASPKSEVRIHGHFYPACRGKCEPILGHMLKGLKVDDNPMLVNPAFGKKLPIVFEDDYIVIVNKPAEFLSVPGISINDSVQTRLKEMYPDATGPLLVHRLDMSTSGLLLAAKNEKIHKHLQSQFIRRKVKKRYLALLEGEVNGENGMIDLPLRVDLDDRPRQLVCYEHGKSAQTEWEVIERKDGKTRIRFYPITGRTHQLRVHSAHPLGLKAPIVGDDLYGQRSSRLHLHAEWLEFTHPFTKERIEFSVEAEF